MRSGRAGQSSALKRKPHSEQRWTSCSRLSFFFQRLRVRLLVMAKHVKKQASPGTDSQVLTGWQQIAAFLGHPAAVVQRWASEGMPVHREGRYVATTRADLNAWLGRQSGKPVTVATENTDLASELKRGLAFIKKAKGVKAQPKR